MQKAKYMAPTFSASRYLKRKYLYTIQTSFSFYHVKHERVHRRTNDLLMHTNLRAFILKTKNINIPFFNLADNMHNNQFMSRLIEDVHFIYQIVFLSGLRNTIYWPELNIRLISIQTSFPLAT